MLTQTQTQPALKQVLRDLKAFTRNTKVHCTNQYLWIFSVNGHIRHDNPGFPAGSYSYTELERFALGGILPPRELEIEGDYTLPPFVPQFSITHSDWQNLAKYTEDTGFRPVLKFIYCDPDHHTLVTTDGTRLMTVNHLDLPQNPLLIPPIKIPGKWDHVQVLATDTQYMLAANPNQHLLFFGPRPSFTYPDYYPIVESDTFHPPIMMQREDLGNLPQLKDIWRATKNNRPRIQLGSGKIVTQDEEEIPIVPILPQFPDIWFNLRYWIDLLESITTDTVFVSWGGGTNSPLKIMDSHDHTYVVLPLRQLQ